MTLLPSTQFGVRGAEGKAYDVEPICAAPGCGQPSVHVHHLWPRSFLRGQPYEWVSVPDLTTDVVIGNRVGLCVDHHNQVTGEIGGHKARIAFKDGLFWWEEQRNGLPRTPLVHQPPGINERVESKRVVVDSDICPTCGKPKHAKPRKPLPARKTKEWTLTVPDDMEIGAELLDEWADDLAEILGFSDQSSRLRRYHAVATVMAWVIQNRSEFVADLAETANA